MLQMIDLWLDSDLRHLAGPPETIVFRGQSFPASFALPCWGAGSLCLTDFPAWPRI